MNIAFISADSEVPVFGTRGSSAHVQELMRAWQHHGCTLDLYAASYGGPVCNEFSGVRMTSLAPRSSSSDGRGSNFDQRAQRERAALATNKALAGLLNQHHRENGYSLVYERHSLWSYAAMEFAAEQRIPGVLEINAPLLEEHIRGQRLVDRASAEDAVMRAYRAATIITTVSRELGHIVEQHPSARGKVRVLPNCVDPSRFGSGAAPALTRTQDEFVIGFTGELLPWQGLTMLLGAFALVVDALPHSRLVIVGEGPEREPLQREIAARGLEKSVTLTGAVSPAAIPGYLVGFDVAVAPYPRLSGFYRSPLKVLEYMAAGLPVVASRIGQVGEIITSSRTGLLVTPGDKEELAQALYDLEQDPARRQTLGAAARDQVRREHSTKHYLEQLLELAGVSAVPA